MATYQWTEALWDYKFVSTAISSNSQYFFACGQDSGLTMSTNYGAIDSWANTTRKSCQAVGSNSDGSFIVVGDKYGLYSSSDYTDTWTQLISGGIYDVALNSTGQQIAACNNKDSYLYMNHNFGNGVWNQYSYPCISVASSANGQYVAFVSAQSSKIGVSSDYGHTFSIISNSQISLTWSSSSDLGYISFCTISMDSTGKYVSIGTYSNGVFTSSNYGMNFLQATDTYSAVSIALDSSGTAGVGVATPLLTSADYGATWASAYSGSTGSTCFSYSYPRLVSISASGQYAIGVYCHNYLMVGVSSGSSSSSSGVDLNVGEKLGIAIGVILAFLLISSVVFYFHIWPTYFAGEEEASTAATSATQMTAVIMHNPVLEGVKKSDIEK